MVVTAGRIPIEAYASTTVSVADRALSSQFHEIKVEIVKDAPERIAIDALQKWVDASDENMNVKQLSSLENAIAKLLDLLTGACDYTKKVVVRGGGGDA